VRLAFLGSPPFAGPIFERVLESAHEVGALVTAPDRPRGRGRAVAPSTLVETARARGVVVLQPASARAADFQAELRALRPEVLLVASYGQILDRAMLALAPHGALNVHASLLPRHRGASPVQAAIRAGDEESGVSIQRIVAALDEGDVLLLKRTPIGARETAGELLGRLAALGAKAAVEALDLVASGHARFTPQDPARATYARKLAKADGVIDWSLPALELERHVRAMTPWPGALTNAPAGRSLIVTAARACPTAAHPTAAPGTLLETRTACVVATGAGVLELERVTAQGKRSMGALEWLHGARLEPGTRLGAAR